MFNIDLHDYICDICNINETAGLFMSIYDKYEWKIVTCRAEGL
jgi:hypothetical protein